MQTYHRPLSGCRHLIVYIIGMVRLIYCPFREAGWVGLWSVLCAIPHLFVALNPSWSSAAPVTSKYFTDDVRKDHSTFILFLRLDALPFIMGIHSMLTTEINQSIKVFQSGLSGTATARSTAGVNVSNKRQETIDRIDVFSAFSERLAVTQRR